MKPNELLEKCKAEVPRLTWSDAIEAGGYMRPGSFAILGNGWRLAALYRDDTAQPWESDGLIIAHLTNERGAGLTFGAVVELDDCVRLAISQVILEARSSASAHERRALDLRACLDALEGVG